ncbi:MAG: macro domain-containing protein [Clostridia bacterium]|nr:macro domain-containing protein [Clostridia bacterium]
MELEIIKANIIDVAADAIVLPANEALREGSGTSKAIFGAAGRKELTKACKELGHCDTGSAIPTLAYDLDAKYIIHAAVPKWIDGLHNEYDLLSSAYLASLKTADVMGCESIVFPLLAAGNNGFDKKLAVQIAEESVSSFEGSNLKKVSLAVYGDTMEVFMKGLGYHVHVLESDVQAARKKEEHKAKQRRLLEDGIDVAQSILEEQMANALEWVKKPENQKKLLDAGRLVFLRLVSRK